MVELAVRSEKPSLDSLTQALRAARDAKDEDEMAHLLVLIVELYSDSQCRCEEKEATYGEDAPEAIACNRSVRIGRDEMLDAFKTIVRGLKGI